jgi:citrate synthase
LTSGWVHTAGLLRGIGIPKALFTPTFAAARAGGWIAHALEQREHNRLIRPDSAYVGAVDRKWTPIDER